MSRPSSRKRGCGATRTTRYRSPAGALAAAPAALAGQPDALTVDGARRDRHLVAALAGWSGQGNPVLPAAVSLLDGQLDLRLLIRARHGAAVAPPQSSKSTQASEPAEQVFKVDVDTFGTDGGPATPTAVDRPPPGDAPAPAGGAFRDLTEVRPVAVIPRPRLRIGQHVVGLVDLLEAFLRRRISVHIRVIPAGQRAKSSLQFFRTGAAWHPKDLVVVARHDGSPPLTGHRDSSRPQLRFPVAVARAEHVNDGAGRRIRIVDDGDHFVFGGIEWQPDID